MSKIKRIAALLLALAMVLGMSITTFADVTDGKITVNGVEEGSTVTYVQIIEPAADEETGWKFAGDAGAAFLKKISELTKEEDDQNIIAGLIVLANPDNGKKLPPALQESKATISNEQFRKAVNAISAQIKSTDNMSGTYEITVKSAGVYAIRATEEASTDKIVAYSPMAAYVAFGYNEDGAASSLDTNVTVNAKKQEITLTKKDSEKDKVTGIHDVVTYTLETVVPYISDDVADTDVYFKVFDTITGAQYVSDSSVKEGDTLGADMSGKVATKKGDKVPVSVSVEGEETARAMEAEIVTGAYGFSLDLKDIASNREKAGKKLTITYKAYVTGTIVDNDAKVEVKTTSTSEVKTLPAEDTLYTGTLKMTKWSADETGKTLSGAKFVLYYEKGGKTYYALTAENTDESITNDGKKVDYIVTGWSTKKPEGDDNLLITGKDGTFTVKGLEDDTGDDTGRVYKFEEVEAPAGYSLNAEHQGITAWENAPEERLSTSEISDTKLSSLPSTGGIGTTIFTIGGCLIMIIAAGLFFATRRKSAK